MARRTTVRLSDELMLRAKRKAQAEGRTLAALIEEGVRHVTDGPRPLPESRTVELPVSKATGGPMPGCENLTYSEIEELEDLEYMARLDRHRKEASGSLR